MSPAFIEALKDFGIFIGLLLVLCVVGFLSTLLTIWIKENYSRWWKRYQRYRKGIQLIKVKHIKGDFVTQIERDDAGLFCCRSPTGRHLFLSASGAVKSTNSAMFENATWEYVNE